ncbi:mitogen-activated protein kinase kinase kinase 3 [Selaginella moellendorffii]|uniref:mitogen-activated protein kinase kinase kinase 3 n=1 Tax=Selaginella moellendorffii TaxID=88036 RepID=UPI000D1C253B|nr:mitogen-activated protein kinase kinase kinase 3 [Selaginella moellendorffii]|eukprot:XP_024525121.1 mitogen-activated protein kinase kinase kinase 3 [Selaginella moellendorffii]
MPSWWGGKSSKEPKEAAAKKQQQHKSKDGMRLQIGSWKTRLSSWTDDERKNSFSPGYRSSSDNSSSSRPVSPCTPSDSARQPWPLPCSPFSPQGAEVRRNQSLPLPPPQEQKPRAGIFAEAVAATSASSSISSSNSDTCDTTQSKASPWKECRYSGNGSTPSNPVPVKATSNNAHSPCLSPCRSPRAILDAGDAFYPYSNSAAAVAPGNSPPAFTATAGSRNPRTQSGSGGSGFGGGGSGGQLSPRHTPHPLPAPPPPPCGSGFPLSPTLSPSNRGATTTCWQKGKLIGNGTFGYVYVGFDSNNIGRMCAMKEVRIIGDNDQSKESAKQLGQEITLLSRLRHQNIVQYYGSEAVEDNLYIYLEYVSGGSIHKLLQDYGPFKESVIRRYTRQILSGLSFLHSVETVHRDIKGANILVDTNGVVKLGDFGMAKHITAQSFPLSCKGSPYWMAPEILKSTHGYDLSVDIWSLGCTVIEMATGKPPWSEFEGVAVMFKIGNSKETPPIPPHLSEECQHFLRLCLQRNPADRPTATELMEHPFVMDIPDTNSDFQTRDGYQTTRYASTPPRQVLSPMFSPSSQFGFQPASEADATAFFLQTPSDFGRRLKSMEDPQQQQHRHHHHHPAAKMRNGGHGLSTSEIEVRSVISDIHHHQRLVSCLDLKC